MHPYKSSSDQCYEATMEATKGASGNGNSLGKTRKTHVFPARISPVEIHDRTRVGRYDHSGQLGIQTTI